MTGLKLENPYKDVPLDKRTCTSITVSDADRAKLLAIHPEASTLQITLNHLLVKFCAALDEHNMRSYDPDGYVEFLNGVKVVGSAPVATEAPEPAVESKAHNKRSKAVA